MIKKFIKVSSCIALIVGLSMLGLANNVSAAALPTDATLASLIPDDATRLGVLDAINVTADPDITETDVLTQEQVDGVTTLSYIDPEIANLEGLQYFTALTSLTVAEGKVEEIPESFVDLTALTTLDIQSNLISMLPNNFTDFAALTTVNLSGNLIATITLEQYTFVAAKSTGGIANMSAQYSVGTIPESTIGFSSLSIAGMPSVYTLIPTLTDGTTMTHTLMKPDQTVEDVTDVISFNGDTMKIEGSFFDQVGEYSIVTTLVGGAMADSTYLVTFTVVDDSSIVDGNTNEEVPNNTTNTLPNTGSNEVLAYMGLLSAAGLFVVRKNI